MIRAMRIAIAGAAVGTFGLSAGEPDNGLARDSPETAGATPVATVDPDMEVPLEAAPDALPENLTPETLPGRCVARNPPSRVIHGPLVRRVVPSRYAKPFIKNGYRYEPRLGDIRNVPPSRTLPGYYEGTKETLYSLPGRDRGYFVLFRW